MGQYKNNAIVKIKEYWYVETRTGYEGPFDSHNEARKYLKLSNAADAARLEFAGLAYSALD